MQSHGGGANFYFCRNRTDVGPRSYNKPFFLYRGSTTIEKFPSVAPRTIFRAGRGNVTSLDSLAIARKGSSVLRFWPPRCAFNYTIIFAGAWAPLLISTDRDGRWSRWLFLFSPFPDVSRLVIHFDYICPAVFSSGEAGGGSKAPRRAPPNLPSDLGWIPFHTQTALGCRMMKSGRSLHFPRYTMAITMS